MTVISAPTRLRAFAATLLLCVPLIAIEVIIVSRAPWWNLPYRRVYYWCIAYSLICLPLISWILAAKKVAYFLALGLAGLWIVSSAWLAIRMSFPTLGFFTITLLLLTLVQFLGLNFELQRSFFDPQMAWYQGLPKAIPGLLCHIKLNEKVLELKVSRIDQDGAIVFSTKNEKSVLEYVSSAIKQKTIKVTFSFRALSLDNVVKPIVFIQRGIGIGIQFIDSTSDSKKEIGDFVEVLRGEGYV